MAAERDLGTREARAADEETVSSLAKDQGLARRAARDAGRTRLAPQAAYRIAAGHVDTGQADTANRVPVDGPEQADTVLDGPVDEQVGHRVAVAVEVPGEGCVFVADRRPAGAGVPVGVARVGTAMMRPATTKVREHTNVATTQPAGKLTYEDYRMYRTRFLGHKFGLRGLA